MGWKISIDGHSLGEDEPFTAGTYATLYALCNLTLPHSEKEMRPLHCPICRNVFVAAALSLRTGIEMDAALSRVAGMSRDDVLGCVTIEKESAVAAE